MTDENVPGAANSVQPVQSRGAKRSQLFKSSLLKAPQPAPAVLKSQSAKKRPRAGEDEEETQQGTESTETHKAAQEEVSLQATILQYACSCPLALTARIVGICGTAVVNLSLHDYYVRRDGAVPATIEVSSECTVHCGSSADFSVRPGRARLFGSTGQGRRSFESVRHRCAQRQVSSSQMVHHNRGTVGATSCGRCRSSQRRKCQRP